jgi:hypothetical protein
MQSSLSVKSNDDPCDDVADVALAPDIAHVVPSEAELSSVLHQAARHRMDVQVGVAPDVTVAPPVQPADTIVRPLLPQDMFASEDRISHHVAPPVDAMVRPAPANDVGDPDARRRKGGPVRRAFLALLSTLIIGLGAVTWKSYGDGASKMIAGFVTQPVVASPQPAQPDKPDVAAQPAPGPVRAEAATAAPDQPAPAAQPVTATPSSTTPPSASSSDSAQQLQSMSRDLAALGQQVEDLKAEMAQMKASQQQVSQHLAKASNLAKASEPTARPKPPALPPRPIAAQTRRPTPPVQSYAPPQATAPQPAVPQIATAPYRSAPQANAAPPVATTPYYPPQRYYGPPPSELPPQASAEPPFDQEYRDSWAPRPPMPVR